MIDNEIRIGDEVRHKMGDLYIVTQLDNVWLYAINLDGYVYEEKRSEFVKTGRHFEQIDKALKQIRENNNVSISKH